jgi:hypothetical protein
MRFYISSRGGVAGVLTYARYWIGRKLFTDIARPVLDRVSQTFDANLHRGSKAFPTESKSSEMLARAAPCKVSRTPSSSLLNCSVVYSLCSSLLSRAKRPDFSTMGKSSLIVKYCSFGRAFYLRRPRLKSLRRKSLRLQVWSGGACDRKPGHKGSHGA